MRKAHVIQNYVVTGEGAILSECENEAHAKEVAGIINSMIQAAYHEGQKQSCTHIDYVGTLYI